MSNQEKLLRKFNAFQSMDGATNALGSRQFAGMGYGQGSSNYMRTNKISNSDLIASVISRIALDASSVEFKHQKINSKTGDQTPIKSGIINCMRTEANIDQSGRAFIYDLIWSLLDEGSIAAVPIETYTIPRLGIKSIETIRVGKIMQYYPMSVRVQCYNEINGVQEDLVMYKKNVAIIESPLYTVLKRENATLKLLQQKLKVMNSQDSNAASGKLNGFLQVPYATRNEMKMNQASKRTDQLEKQMANSKYGLGTLDANEKYISAGVGINNNLLGDIRNLQQDFYNQTGITDKVLNGTANEAEMNLYYNRTIDPILQAVIDAFNRTFLTREERDNGEIITYYRDPFKTLPVAQMATAADLFTRNAIFTPNEIRQFLGKPPSPDPLANALFNRNISDGNQNGGISTPGQFTPTVDSSDAGVNSATDYNTNV